jgi:hypothetical protein
VSFTAGSRSCAKLTRYEANELDGITVELEELAESEVPLDHDMEDGGGFDPVPAWVDAYEI